MKKLIPDPILDFADFSGRMSRSRFWRWVLFLVIVYAIAITIDRAIVAPWLGFLPFEEGAVDYVTYGAAILLALPWLASTVRRLHDIDRTGWWMLLALPTLVLPFFSEQIGFWAYQNISDPQLQQWAFTLLPVAPAVFMLPILYFHLKSGDASKNRFGTRD